MAERDCMTETFVSYFCVQICHVCTRFWTTSFTSQFLRNYIDIPLLKNVKAEDIEDVTERYVPMFTEERNSDTVKRIKLAGNNTLFFVSLIEHKTKVDYNVCMQLSREG